MSKHTSSGGDKPRATSFDILPHDGVSGSFSDDSMRNWLVWVVGIVLSLIPLMALPIGRAFAIGWHFEWISDIFGNPGVLLISVSMSVAIIFELTARGSKVTDLLKYKAFIITLAALAYLIYGLFIGIGAYSEYSGGSPLEYGHTMTIVGVMLLLAVFYCGTCFFVPDKVKAIKSRIKKAFKKNSK